MGEVPVVARDGEEAVKTSDLTGAALAGPTPTFWDKWREVEVALFRFRVAPEEMRAKALDDLLSAMRQRDGEEVPDA